MAGVSVTMQMTVYCTTTSELALHDCSGLSPMQARNTHVTLPVSTHVHVAASTVSQPSIDLQMQMPQMVLR